MATADEIEQAKTAWVRKKIREMKANGDPFREIGKIFGSSHVWPQQLLNPKKYGEKTIGLEMETKIAERFFGGSTDRFRAEALRAAGLYVAPEPKPLVVREGAELPDDQAEIAAARLRYPELAALDRYGDEHCLAAAELERVHRHSRLVANSLVKKAIVESYDESSPLGRDMGLRVANIVQLALEVYASAANLPGKPIKPKRGG